MLPLSFAQERLWFLDQLEPGSPAYNMPGGLRLAGPLDARALAAALSEIVRRHETLRTSFPAVAGQPVQRVAPPAAVPLPVLDLAALPEEARRDELRRLAAEEARRSFDLATGPPARFHLVRLAGAEHALLVTLHHIVADGWSIEVLARELTALYAVFAGGAAGELSPLRELEVQYADYALWQRGWLQGEVLEAQVAWWRQRLAGAPERLDLPTDRPRPAVQSLRGRRLPVALREPLAAGLEALGRQGAATPFMVLLAGLQALLGRYTGQRDLLVGSTVAGRTRAEIEPLIGFFVNTLVLRADLADDPAFGEALARARETALEAWARQDLPFEKLVEALRPRRDLGHAPFCQVLVSLQSTPLELALPGLEIARLPVDGGSAKFDLTLELRAEAGGWAGSLEYSTDLFDEATVARLWDHLRTLLAGAVAEPGSRLSDLPLLSAAERRQLAAWNETGSASGGDLRGDACLHELFVAQAARTPEAVAVLAGERAGEESLTYAELAAAPTVWPTTCGGWAWGRRSGWGCSWSARPTWW